MNSHIATQVAAYNYTLARKANDDIEKIIAADRTLAKYNENHETSFKAMQVCRELRDGFIQIAAQLLGQTPNENASERNQQVAAQLAVLPIQRM